MNVYDFDKTIFYPDSLTTFIKWCILRYPKLLVDYCPKTAVMAFLLAIKRCSVTAAVEQLASFVKFIPDIDKEVEEFWAENEWRISEWYLAQKKETDLIVSASPEFFLKPLIEKLGVNLIGTQLDKKTGKIAGRCCYGKEKVKYLVISNYFPQHKIDEFYSDSITDTPLAYCAEKAFLVTNKGRKVVPWPKISSRVKNKILNTLL